MYLEIIKVKFEFVLCRKASVAQRAALIIQLCFFFDKGDYGVNNFFSITAKITLI